VDCGVPWTWDTIEAAVEKGAHKSATSPKSIALIAEDFAYQEKWGTRRSFNGTSCKRSDPST
jgi:hypothetical protein